LIQGDTGIGKTNILQSIAESFQNVYTLMFEMELPKEDMFERFCASRLGVKASEIETEYRDHGANGPEVIAKMFPKLFICPESKLSIERIEAIVLKSELKMGCKPMIVLVDYAQLITGKGQSRYERASSVAEGLKVLAKETNTVVFVTSQIDRGSARDGENGLHSAKDSGSLESSAGLVLGIDRNFEDTNLMQIKVLKATKGGAGLVIDCDFDGARSKITEREQEYQNT
jgi:replicative DNA helicase